MDKPVSKEYLRNSNCCVDKSEIKRIRKEKNLRLEDLAEMTGLSRNGIWKLESYNYGIQLCNFLKVAKALGVDPDVLLLDDNSTITD